ncbi:hypothetical protein [Leisingera caerulea]|uniref:hypothetical protein n=1 Tax=Leisingera caerulea TaxID=506591 RepID=UPI0003FFA781|nr:hypothetical protein [Leisingera caerulea]
MSNHPPHTVLELSREETQWLFSLLSKAEKSADEAFEEVVSMSSKDPRARHRVMLQMAANIDQAISDSLLSRLEKQDPNLERGQPILNKS